jgi:ribosomal 30S subunit maturation factor RimM
MMHAYAHAMQYNYGAKHLRCYSRNWGSDQRKMKQDLLLKIERWDKIAEERELSNAEWAYSYEKEEELVKNYENGELFWQRRGGRTGC